MGNYNNYAFTDGQNLDKSIKEQGWLINNRKFRLFLTSKFTVIKADRLVGELNSFSNLIPDIEIYIKMHIKNEAQKSSKIEGTQTELDEVILPEKAIKPEKRMDWKEVQNYIAAINYAIEQLKKRPVTMRLVNETHKILLRGARGAKHPIGEIRKKQNCIGTKDLSGRSRIEDAYFIPPHQSLPADLLSDLERFWNSTSTEIKLPELIKVAITHYQFETLHPYNDGNGRIGRLLIILQLINYGLLEKPILYLSDYLEKNRGFYIDSLSAVRQTNKLIDWIKFFLGAVTATAEKASNTFKKINDLRKEYEDIIISFGSTARNGKRLLLKMFSKPIMSKNEISRELGVSYYVADRLVKRFINKNIVIKYTPVGFKKRYYVLWKYLDLFR